MKHKVVITTHRPWLRWAVVCGGTALLGISAWGLYSYTRATTITDFERARSERDRLLEERRQLGHALRAANGQVEELKEQVVYLERSQEIDKQACSTVKASLAGLQGQVAELQEQVAFYRGIVSPEESRVGVRVYEFKVFPTATSNVYRYDLVLIQSVRHDRRVAGRIEIGVQGLRSGGTEVLRLTDLAVGGGQNLLFSFKYFEEFGGEFKLPAGFRPMRVNIAVVPEGSGMPRVEDDYEWNKIQGGSNG